MVTRWRGRISLQSWIAKTTLLKCKSPTQVSCSLRLCEVFKNPLINITKSKRKILQMESIKFEVICPLEIFLNSIISFVKLGVKKRDTVRKRNKYVWRMFETANSLSWRICWFSQRKVRWDRCMEKTGHSWEVVIFPSTGGWRERDNRLVKICLWVRRKWPIRWWVMIISL